MTGSCWNPRCERPATTSFPLVDGAREVCGECVKEYYAADAFCQGCGWGYGPTEEPVDEDNYYLGCEKCPRWTHRLCDPELAIGVFEQHFIDEYVCGSCRRAAQGTTTWKFLAQYGRGLSTDLTLLSDPLPIVAGRERPGGALYPCLLLGFDFRTSKPPAILLCLTGAKWQQWNLRLDNVVSVTTATAASDPRTAAEWQTFASPLPEVATQRVAEIRRRFTQDKKSRKRPLTDTIAQGLVDPLADLAFEDPSPAADHPPAYPPLSLVWAKVPGLVWAPGVVSWVSRETGEALVFFLEGLTASTRKYAFVSEGGLKAFDPELDHHAAYVKQTRGTRKLVEAVTLAEAVRVGSQAIPDFIVEDARGRAEVQTHVDGEMRTMGGVRRAVKLQHMKLFLETNMLEMHWRTIARARQYVKAAEDVKYGGYHLVAAQDWPTDKEVAAGETEEVYLVYCGDVLTKTEADAMENDQERPDRNRYVAEIPGTKIIAGADGSNVNTTGENLFVDGFKYADPTSPIWAPGPTANHEREVFCKLEPRHAVADNLRGFWLQRKRGCVIRRGEPLFWSYDCGAGKFDSDFALDGQPAPVGLVLDRLKHL